MYLWIRRQIPNATITTPMIPITTNRFPTYLWTSMPPPPKIVRNKKTSNGLNGIGNETSAMLQSNPSNPQIFTTCPNKNETRMTINPTQKKKKLAINLRR